MSVSDDIGALVLLLAQHTLECYDPELPRRECEQSDLYFDNLKYLLANHDTRDKFNERLPYFQRQTVELAKKAMEMYDDDIEGGRIVNYFTSLGTVVAAGLCMYAWFTQGCSKLTGSSFLAATSFFMGGTYFWNKNQRRQITLQLLEQHDQAVGNASPQEWMEAFRTYRVELSGEVREFMPLTESGGKRRCKKTEVQ